MAVQPAVSIRLLSIRRLSGSILQSRANLNTLHCIRIDLDGLNRLWRAAEPVFKSARWQEGPTEGLRYHFANNSFPFKDALMLRAMRHLDRSRRMVKIGAGFTTAAMLDTLDSLDAAKKDLTLIQPYPTYNQAYSATRRLGSVQSRQGLRTEFAPRFFMELSEGDVLFIESTNFVKTCSDVVRENVEMFSHLTPGVGVHFHDTFHPFEYRKEWVLDMARSWSEIYRLRPYLSGKGARRGHRNDLG